MKIIIKELLILCLGLTGFLIVATAHAENSSYYTCVNKCYLDIPGKTEFIKDERRYWDVSNITDSQLTRDYKSMVKHAKIDCRINCVVEEITIEDPAVKFYDTNVKNFPLTNE